MARRKKTKTDEVRSILQEHSPEAAQCLCEMLNDDSLTGTTRVSVAKEILERSVGKGQLTDADSGTANSFKLTLKVVE